MPANYPIALKLWWAVFWRSYFAAVLVFIAGIVIFAIFPVPENSTLEGVLGLLLLVFLIVCPLWVYLWILRKGFGRYRLLVVEKKTAK
jgi:hypothetical protein